MSKGSMSRDKMEEEEVCDMERKEKYIKVYQK